MNNYLASLKGRAKPLLLAAGMCALGHIFMSALNMDLVWHLLFFLLFAGLFIKSTEDKNSIFVFRVVVPMVIGLGCVVLYRYLYTIPNAAGFLTASKTNSFHIERLFELLSTLYAICTAFLLWKGLTDLDKLRSILKEESSQIQSIMGFTKYFSDRKNKLIVSKIRGNFDLYLNRIFSKNGITQSEENWGTLNETSLNNSHKKGGAL